MKNSLWWEVHIPTQVITNRTLSVSARCLYMLLTTHCPTGTQTYQMPIKELLSCKGLRHQRNLEQHLRELATHGFITHRRQPGQQLLTYTLPPLNGRTVPVPAYLIQEPVMLPTTKLLWVLIRQSAPEQSLAGHPSTGQSIAGHSAPEQSLAGHPSPGQSHAGHPSPGQSHPGQTLTKQPRGLRLAQSDLTALLGWGSDNTVRRGVRNLAAEGWLQVSCQGPGRTHTYTPHDAHYAMRCWVRDTVVNEIHRQEFKGEAIMKEMLTALVPDLNLEDNCRPDFITNPLTLRPLEIDRYYGEAGVAFEFNGPQHYQPTAKFPEQEAVQAQRARDLMKEALLRRHGLHLITIHAHDLSFPRLRDQIGELMAVRIIRPTDPIVRILKKIGRKYRRRARLPEGNLLLHP